MSYEPFPADFPVIPTPRLLLREIVESDLPALLAYLSQPAVYESTSADPWTEDAVGALVLASQEGFASRDMLRWGIATGPDGPLIGTCGLFALNQRDRRSEIGYDLSPACWGRGYMAETVGALLSYGFSALALERIEATVMTGNQRSAKVLLGAGFRREGTLGGYKLVRGTRRDFWMYGLLRNDWRRGAAPTSR